MIYPGKTVGAATNKEAKIHYGDGDFAMLAQGDHVICAVTGRKIPIAELRYWSVDRQEAYVDAAASLKAELATRN